MSDTEKRDAALRAEALESQKKRALSILAQLVELVRQDRIMSLFVLAESSEYGVTGVYSTPLLNPATVLGTALTTLSSMTAQTISALPTQPGKEMVH